MIKMYILVKQSLPSHKVIAVAHGTLMCYLKFKDDINMKTWLDTSFRKVVCEVTDEEFELAKKTEDRVVVTESYLDGMECALVFCPRTNYPAQFKTYPLLNV